MPCTGPLVLAFGNANPEGDKRLELKDSHDETSWSLLIRALSVPSLLGWFLCLLTKIEHNGAALRYPRPAEEGVCSPSSRTCKEEASRQMRQGTADATLANRVRQGQTKAVRH